MNLPRTSKPEYGPYLLEALATLGEASREQLLAETHRLMSGRLTPADHELLQGGALPRWVNQAENMLDGLIEDEYVEDSGGSLRVTVKGRLYLGRG